MTSDYENFDSNSELEKNDNYINNSNSFYEIDNINLSKLSINFI